MLTWLERGWKFGMERAQKFRDLAIIVATAVIVIGIVWTIRAHPEIMENLSWGAVAMLTFVLTPVLVVLGAIEFSVMATCLGTPMRLDRALFVTVIGSAANLLPIPGTMMTRIAALKAAGASATRGTQITLLHGILWMAMTMILGGGSIILAGFRMTGAGTLVAGVVLGAIVASSISTLGGTRPLIARLIVLRLIGVFLDGARVAVALAAIGTAIPIVEAMIFTLASSFGSALSLVPAGLGVREVLSGALSPIIGISIALGFAAAVLIRLADLAVVSVLAVSLGIKEKFTSGES